jgi:hypothetical protein
VVPRFDGGLEPGDLCICEVEFSCRVGERRVPYRPLLSVHQFALDFDGFLFVGVEGELVLHRPNRANRPDVCPLRTQQRVQVQALGVVVPDLEMAGFASDE